MDKGIEGIDYLVTECGHCNGNGKCACVDCIFFVAEKAVTDTKGRYATSDRNSQIDYFLEKKLEAKCSVCNGVGKVVFWRPRPGDIDKKGD